jgi:hypothetical protein
MGEYKRAEIDLTVGKVEAGGGNFIKHIGILHAQFSIAQLYFAKIFQLVRRA